MSARPQARPSAHLVCVFFAGDRHHQGNELSLADRKVCRKLHRHLKMAAPLCLRRDPVRAGLVWDEAALALVRDVDASAGQVVQHLADPGQNAGTGGAAVSVEQHEKRQPARKIGKEFGAVGLDGQRKVADRRSIFRYTCH